MPAIHGMPQSEMDMILRESDLMGMGLRAPPTEPVGRYLETAMARALNPNLRQFYRPRGREAP